MSQPDAWRMIRRRAAAAGIAAEIGCHTFRATGITAYLANGGALEHAQNRIDRRSVFARARVQGAIGWDVLWLCDPEEPATLGLLAANIQSKRRPNEESGNGQRTPSFRFAADSLLEGDGFELSVPRQR
jgi:hypothetical protein